ncbi:MAG: tRNA-splicing endonuclease subunit [Trichoglossum hirsutum]|nr:MAG: tRNA-splicing endonuclease subunit [Trichoglossum hirsutum]
MTHLKSTGTDQLYDRVIRISLIGGRYLIFDIDDITYLRTQHHICGVLSGSIPHLQQQNVFLGVPAELMPEEARLLVEEGVAFVVDDVAWHRKGLKDLGVEEKRVFLQTLEARGWDAAKAAEQRAKERSECALKKKKRKQDVKLATPAEAITPITTVEETQDVSKNDNTGESLFTSPPSPTPSTTTTTSIVPPRRPSAAPTSPHIIIPTTSYPPLPLPSRAHTHSLLPAVPSSYPLFAHLHSQNYFLSPGLRFGCQYLAYPGDPLRFHSHFLAVGFDWDEEFSLLDLVAGGRLGTGVKKGFLIGGLQPQEEAEQRGAGVGVKTFCIEWGGM